MFNNNKERDAIPLKPSLRSLSPEQERDLIGTCLDKEKAEEIFCYDLRGKTPMADFMFICTGRSTTHIKALSEKIVQKCKDNAFSNVKIEGQSTGDWVIVDAGDIIIHLFRDEVRRFYELDKLWQECATDWTLQSEHAYA